MWENFFYYDLIPIEDQNEKDLTSLLLQPTNSLFYNRSEGVDMKYNFPQVGLNGLLLAFAIVSAVSRRNQYVTDGSNNSLDRRIAVSQSFVSVEDVAPGERNVNVYYFNYANYENPVKLNSAVV